jgi:hypothetical protein
MDAGSYLVEMTASGDGFQVVATPGGLVQSAGARGFFVDQTGIMRVSPAGQDAGPGSPPTGWTAEKPDAIEFLEKRALETVREIAAANAGWKEKEESGGKYADDLKTLAERDDVDVHLLAGPVAGYTYAYTSFGTGFKVIARPAKPGKTGRRAFFVDETGTVRQTKDGSSPNAQSEEVPEE